MQRISENSKSHLEVFHTQEARSEKLTAPILCTRSNAWLGVGYYFWTDEEFAHNWGKDSKTRTKFYDIYKVLIDEDKVLNATFNEESYFLFLRSIEKARKHLAKSISEDISLINVHRFLSDKIWGKLGIKGIIFDDIPKNVVVKGRIYSDIEPLYYKKRIQIVLFDTKNIITFAQYSMDQECH